MKFAHFGHPVFAKFTKNTIVINDEDSHLLANEIKQDGPRYIFSEICTYITYYMYIYYYDVLLLNYLDITTCALNAATGFLS